MQDAATAWPDQIFDLLKRHSLRQVALVPDAGHARLIRRCLADNTMEVVTLTTEEEGVAMLSGTWLGGDKGVLLMQSSGVGNCVNMLPLPLLHRTPMPMIVTMRGDFGEFTRRRCRWATRPRIAADTLKLVLPPRDGAYLQTRMREAVLGPDAHHQL